MKSCCTQHVSTIRLSCLANPQLSISYHQLQLAMANSAISRQIKAVQKVKMVYSTSIIRLGVYLFTSYPLAITSYSQLQLALANSAISSQIKKLSKGKLVYSTNTIRPYVQLIPSYQLAIASCSYLWLTQLFQVKIRMCRS